MGAWGVSHRDFCEMHPAGFWLMYKSKVPPKMYGSCTEAEMRELYEATYGENRNADS